MALVDYSGSESSDEEQKPINKEIVKPKASSNKPAFQKVVDRSDPHKIKVTLPEPAKVAPVGEEDGRPSKRAKMGSGGLGGFNALLPAPKRAATSNGGASTIGNRRGGLGSGVNLRTGAAPGFSREPERSTELMEDEQLSADTDEAKGLGQHQNRLEDSTARNVLLSSQKPIEDLKPKGKTTMFKPLSVARKPQKKKAHPTEGSDGTKIEASGNIQQLKPAPKVSLFSPGDSSVTTRTSTATKGAYQPMVYHSIVPNPTPSTPETPEDFQPEGDSLPTSKTQHPPEEPQSLNSIASDLNLSASAKRQLLGRQKNHPSAVNIVNFNTDEEYAANEAFRQSGEQVQHNPVRAIAPGKHSLKQLVNMGTTQADALEEHFATGRRNRSEAGSKYGW